jgi:ATP-dependent RNA helicase RhlE
MSKILKENAFSRLGLSPALTNALAAAGYCQPTPVQAKAIQPALQGRDLMVAAQTGTGKTASFALPILEKMFCQSQVAITRSRLRPKATKVLVLTPTRELAAQVHDNFRTYAQNLDLVSACIFGGVGMAPQIEIMAKGVDVLVACPGRLLDLVGQNAISLNQVETFVLDEADRMLDMGFIHDVKKVMARLPARRQNLLYSATFSQEIIALANQLLHSPERIEVTPPNTTVERIQQAVYHVPIANHKKYLLEHLIKVGQWEQVLVFTRTKHGANKLSEFLCKQSISSAAIHGNKSQTARTKALADFKSGEVRVLVATDIAARGLDIDQLPHVVNFELPNVEEDYVHRIGRTGRAGRSGEAVSLVSPDEVKLLSDIERMTKQRIPEGDWMGFEFAKMAAVESDARNLQPNNSRDTQRRNNTQVQKESNRHLRGNAMEFGEVQVTRESTVNNPRQQRKQLSERQDRKSSEQRSEQPESLPSRNLKEKSESNRPQARVNNQQNRKSERDEPATQELEVPNSAPSTKKARHHSSNERQQNYERQPPQLPDTPKVHDHALISAVVPPAVPSDALVNTKNSKRRNKNASSKEESTPPPSQHSNNKDNVSKHVIPDSAAIRTSSVSVTQIEKQLVPRHQKEAAKTSSMIPPEEINERKSSNHHKPENTIPAPASKPLVSEAINSLLSSIPRPSKTPIASALQDNTSHVREPNTKLTGKQHNRRRTDNLEKRKVTVAVK